MAIPIVLDPIKGQFVQIIMPCYLLAINWCSIFLRPCQIFFVQHALEQWMMSKDIFVNWYFCYSDCYTPFNVPLHFIVWTHRDTNHRDFSFNLTKIYFMVKHVYFDQKRDFFLMLNYYFFLIVIMNINEHFNAQHFENNFPIVIRKRFNVGHFSIIFPL